MRNRKGWVLVCFALLLPVLLGIMGIAVDSGYLYLLKSELQNAADAGALSGAALITETGGIYQDAARHEAEKYVTMNTRTATSREVTFGVFDHVNRNFIPNVLPVNAVRVTVYSTPDSLLFGKIMGWSSYTVGAHAIAGYKPEPIVSMAAVTEGAMVEEKKVALLR